MYPQFLPKKYDGTGNFGDWVSKFECISAMNGWNEGEKAFWLRELTSQGKLKTLSH